MNAPPNVHCIRAVNLPLRPLLLPFAAMVKSFQTSGGTVLSTNWSEVAQADYEKDRQAPEGQVWKKWG